MPDLTTEELTALPGAVGSLCDAAARGFGGSLGLTVTSDAPTLTLDAADGLAADLNVVLQASFSYPVLCPDEGLLVLSADTWPVLAKVLGWQMAGEEPRLTGDQTAGLEAAMNAAVLEVRNALGIPGEPGAVQVQVGALQLPPSFAVVEKAIRASVPVHIGSDVAELLVFLTTEFARSLIAAAPSANPEVEPAAQPSDDTVVETQRSNGAGTEPLPPGIELLFDVPLDVSVELGRVRMLIKDVLELSPGSVVELDRVAGEPVDLMVNGRLIAKGEVVVVEDNFGIRVTEIISPADRVSGLGKRR
ncbi:MAG: flagellar motor switch protein FliN [Chthonomonadales bacterium]